VGLGAGLLLTTAALAFVWTQVLVIEQRDVAVPAVTASPGAVVRAYLEAVDAHDCKTAAALWADASDGVERSCPAAASVTDIQVTEPPLQVDARTTYVPVQFNWHDRWLTSEPTGFYGSTTWGYDLEREGLDGPWRIVGQGVG